MMCRYISSDDKEADKSKDRKKNFLQEFDKLEGSRTEKIEVAMNMYIHSKESVNKDRLESSESIKNFRERIIALEEGKIAMTLLILAEKELVFMQEGCSQGRMKNIHCDKP